MIRPKTESTPLSSYQVQGQAQPSSPQASPSPQTGNEQAGDGLGEDQNQAMPPQTAEGEANLCHFEPQGEANTNMSLQSFGDEDSAETGDSSGYFDPGVQALQQQARDNERTNQSLMEEGNAGSRAEAQEKMSPADAEILLKIHEMDHQLIKEMLDMIQRSLDRARQMMEQNMQDYYQKVQPQQQAIEKQLNTARALEAAGDQAAAQAQVRQLGDLSQQLQEALSRNPDFHANPAAQQILANLSTIQQLSGRAE